MSARYRADAQVQHPVQCPRCSAEYVEDIDGPVCPWCIDDPEEVAA